MEKINIAEILNNCPSNMELDCTMYDTKVFYQGLNTRIPTHPIVVRTEHGFEFELTQYGQIHNIVGSKCVIFPKGKTTWENFTPPVSKTFKDGDIIYNRFQNRICIYQCVEDGSHCINYCRFNEFNKTFELLDDYIWIAKQDYRLATEEEKQKLFNAIKENGYKWNEETKTVEKLIVPKFKVGDRIKHRLTGDVHVVLFVLSNGCGGGVYDVSITNEIGKSINIEDQDNYELVPNKFDITILKPFDKVLVRTKTFSPTWAIDFYDGYQPNVGGSFTPFGVSGGKYFQQCIPYEGNEHLRGTTKDCVEYYKTWEK